MTTPLPEPSRPPRARRPGPSGCGSCSRTTKIRTPKLSFVSDTVLYGNIEDYTINVLPSGPVCGSADFNCDGDTGTDQDIEAFFSCLAGNCPAAPCNSTADFNGDGDVGTDADIEAFFRVLAGGNC